MPEADQRLVDDADARIEHPAPDQDGDDRRRRPRHEQQHAADRLQPILAHGPAGQQERQRSPSTMRTVTPMMVSQTTVFHSTRWKSRLAHQLDIVGDADPLAALLQAEQAEVGERVLDVEERRIDEEADRKKNVGTSIVTMKRLSPLMRTRPRRSQADRRASARRSGEPTTLVLRQFLGDGLDDLGRGLLGSLLADEHRAGAAPDRVPHERDGDRAGAVRSPAARRRDLRREARRDLLRQAVVVHHRPLRLHIVGVVLRERRLGRGQEADELPGRLDILRVGADAEHAAAEEGLRAVDVGRMRRGGERDLLAGVALLEGLDDLHADGVGHADEGDRAVDHALDQFRRAPQADREVGLGIVPLVEIALVVLQRLGQLVGRDVDWKTCRPAF